MALSQELETIFMLEEVSNNTGVEMAEVVLVIKEWEKQKYKNQESKEEL
ncbi:hypothetical protein CHOTACABRAS_179 [Bacillus phage Chotacabras]|nr:hypothetical protein CHOTACABRAS_179 [Bacillus phage Chotacabras]